MAENKPRSINPIKKWFYSLIGKRDVIETEVKTQSEEKENSKEINQIEIEEDSVASDVRRAKLFLKSLFEKMVVFVNPYLRKGVSLAGSARKEISPLVDKKFIRLILKIFIVFVMVLILLYMALGFVRRLKKEGVFLPNTPTPQPSVIPYNPYNPSVYNKDPQVIEIDENLKILDRELNNLNLRESGLNPPSLDWDIKF